MVYEEPPRKCDRPKHCQLFPVESRKTTKLIEMVSTIQAKCAESSEWAYIVL